MPYDLQKFSTSASALVAEQLSNVVDIHYRPPDAASFRSKSMDFESQNPLESGCFNMCPVSMVQFAPSCLCFSHEKKASNDKL